MQAKNIAWYGPLTAQVIGYR